MMNRFVNKCTKTPDEIQMVGICGLAGSEAFGIKKMKSIKKKFVFFSFSLADIIFILLAIMIAIGLKHHYSQASVEDLNWILAPTVEFVEQLSGITFEKEAYTGFISKTHRIIIAKSCAGVNFLIIAFCMLIFSRVRATKPVGAKILFFIKSIITAYFLTIIVNALRIILAIHLYNADIYGGWLTREMLHRIEGTAIYFMFLCFIYFVFVSRQSTNKSTARRAIKTPLFWYLIVTLFVPLVRRSLQGDLSGFFEHSLVVIIILIIILLFFFLLKSMVRSVKATIHSMANIIGQSKYKKIG
jgi:exosortase K